MQLQLQPIRPDDLSVAQGVLLGLFRALQRLSVVAGTVSTAADKSPGHALLLNNHAVVLKGFEVVVQFLVSSTQTSIRVRDSFALQGFASDAVTFEAWLSSSDVCNAGQSSAPLPNSLFFWLVLVACNAYFVRPVLTLHLFCPCRDYSVLCA